MKLFEPVCAWGPALQSMAANVPLLDAARADNPWFTHAMQRHALQALVPWFDPSNLRGFVAGYPEPAACKRVGLILAGNLPLVGLHDVLMVLLAGHQAIIKPSHKDQKLLRALIAASPLELQSRVAFVDRLEVSAIDALIATGSDATAQQIRAAFASVPNLLRGTRHSLAVLDGGESAEELAGLAADILGYHGMGCRSVSVVLVPQGYELAALASALNAFPRQSLASQWFDVVRYETSMAKMLGTWAAGADVIAVQRASGLESARLGCLNVVTYEDMAQVDAMLRPVAGKLQVVACATRLSGDLSLPCVPLGDAQLPSLGIFADHIDTLQWLLGN